VVSISGAAARDDVYDLIELAFANRTDPVKIAQIAEALEESIPHLDPQRFRSELEHVLEGPELPQLVTAKEMATAVLEGRPLAPHRDSAVNAPESAGPGFLARAAGLLRGQFRRPPD
jgi:hypothetical protein